jgi:Sulfatase
VYDDVVKELDLKGVGSVLDRICGDANNDGVCEGALYQNTLILFTSDNGPYRGDAAELPTLGSTGGMRGAKKFTYEGGVRVPFIAQWPAGNWDGGGNRTLGQLADMRDIFPTLVRVALKDSGLCPADNCVKNGVYANDTARIQFTGKDNVPYDIAIDGKDISNVLDTGAANTDQKNVQISWLSNYAICIQAEDGICTGYQDSHPFAIRSNVTFNVPSDIANYKLHFKKDVSYGVNKPEELYNLSTNLSESESFDPSLSCYSGSVNYCSCYIGSSNLCCVGSTNYCSQCSINNTTNVATCPSELGTYKSIVETLWRRANMYQENVKNNKCEGALFTNKVCP